VHDRAVRERLTRPVVVAHDDLDTERARVGDLLDGRDAAVDRDEQGRAGRRLPLDARHGQPVAVARPARQLADRRRAEPL
jgi:hypothetical protein